MNSQANKPPSSADIALKLNAALDRAERAYIVNDRRERLIACEEVDALTDQFNAAREAELSSSVSNPNQEQ
jgi:hypothetical protein